MTRCPTTAGVYRCSRPEGHAENCEAYDLTWVGRVTGRRLDELGSSQYGVKRAGRSDPAYTAAILESLG